MSSAAERNPTRSLLGAFEAVAPSPVRTKKSRGLAKRVSPSSSQRHRRDEEEEPSLNWPVVFWLAFLHVGAVAAFWTFSWQGLVVMLFWHWLNGCIGITLTYHRLLTHSSYQTYRPIKGLLTILGGLAGEGTAIDWVANHRQHHALSDQPGDPHSPRDGAWWSHMFWLAYTLKGEARDRHVRRWAPDLEKDPMMRWIGAMFIPSHFILGGILLAAGYAMGGWYMAASLLVYGLFLRLVLVLHTTWLVNSASHMWGYKNYETTDDSRNNWFVALIAYGEGWHNNHHAYPRMAPHGHKWWEFDLTYLIIRGMKAVGLAWDVVDYKQKKLGGE
jgi:stearoyl-CoA desaturase (delta-9 desaturase)